jgi:hypothetical protein
MTGPLLEAFDWDEELDAWPWLTPAQLVTAEQIAKRIAVLIN